MPDSPARPTPDAALVPVRGAAAQLPAPFDPALLAGQLAPSSIAMYRRDAAAYLAFAQSPAAAADPATLARWRAHLAQETALSPNTINRMLAAVKRIVREAASQGYLDGEAAAAFARVPGVRPLALKERLKPAARVRISPAAMRALCEAPALPAPRQSALKCARDRALLHTMASSGLRVDEVATLTAEQLVQRDGHCFVRVQGKNDLGPREAPLSREAHGLIRDWLAARPVGSRYIFTSFDGYGERRLTERHLTPEAIWQIVRVYAGRLGLDDIKPHDFRRFVGTQLARVDIRKAQKALGHKRIDTTAQHYVLDDLDGGLTDGLF